MNSGFLLKDLKRKRGKSFLGFLRIFPDRLGGAATRPKEREAHERNGSEQLSEQRCVGPAGRIGYTSVHENDFECGSRKAERGMRCGILESLNCEESVVDRAELVARDDDYFAIKATDQIADCVVFSEGNQQAAGALH